MLTNSDTKNTVPELRSFRRGLRALERRVEQALEDQTSCCGVSAAQCHLILEMAEAGAGSIGFFAERLELDISTLSRTVESLVQAGLALRAADPGDRRRQLVALSADGAERAKAINQSCDAYYAALLASLPARLREAALEVVPLLANAMGAYGQASERIGSGCCSRE
jgi:DNA-binding MarR family transcriptional regulator